MASKSLQRRLRRTALARIPRRADGGLAVGAGVSDMLNRQAPSAGNPRYETALRGTPNQCHNHEVSAPRSARIMARYDF